MQYHFPSYSPSSNYMILTTLNDSRMARKLGLSNKATFCNIRNIPKLNILLILILQTIQFTIYEPSERCHSHSITDMGWTLIKKGYPIYSNLNGKDPDNAEGSSRCMFNTELPLTGEMTLPEVPELIALSGTLLPLARVAVTLLREISIASLWKEKWKYTYIDILT